MTANVLVCLSAGIDSTVLLFDLLTLGVSVEAFTLDTGQAAREELIRSAELCHRHGIKHHVHYVPNLQTLLSPDVEPFAGQPLVVAASADIGTATLGVRSLRVMAGWKAAIAQLSGLRSGGTVGVYAPYAERSKADIVRLGRRLGVPLERTWSCLRGGRLHCGHCRGCMTRREAFRAASVPDRTVYAGPATAYTPRVGPNTDWAA